MEVCIQASLENNGDGNCKVLSLLCIGIHYGRHFIVIRMQGELVTPCRSTGCIGEDKVNEFHYHVVGNVYNSV